MFSPVDALRITYTRPIQQKKYLELPVNLTLEE